MNCKITKKVQVGALNFDETRAKPYKFSTENAYLRWNIKGLFQS